MSRLHRENVAIRECLLNKVVAVEREILISSEM